jgi:hypothetical protein
MVQIGKFIKDNKTLERDRAYLRGVLESMWFREILTFYRSFLGLSARPLSSALH